MVKIEQNILLERKCSKISKRGRPTRPKIKCLKCNLEKHETKFYVHRGKNNLFNKEFLEERANTLQYCKDCITDIWNEIFESYEGDKYMTFNRICQIVNIPYNKRLADTMFKNYQEEAIRKKKEPFTKSLPNFLSQYFKFLTSAFKSYYNDYTYEETDALDLQELYTKYYVINDEIVEASKRKFPAWLRKTGEDDEDLLGEALDFYKYLEGEVAEPNNVTNRFYMRATSISYMKLNKTMYGGGDIKMQKEHQKVFEENLKILGLDPKKLNDGNANKSELGLKIQDLEMTSPADYYSNKAKMKKLRRPNESKNYREYFQKMVVEKMVARLEGVRGFEGIDRKILGINREITDEAGLKLLLDGKEEAIKIEEHEDE